MALVAHNQQHQHAQQVEEQSNNRVFDSHMCQNALSRNHAKWVLGEIIGDSNSAMEIDKYLRTKSYINAGAIHT